MVLRSDCWVGDKAEGSSHQYSPPRAYVWNYSRMRCFQTLITVSHPASWLLYVKPYKTSAPASHQLQHILKSNGGICWNILPGVVSAEKKKKTASQLIHVNPEQSAPSHFSAGWTLRQNLMGNCCQTEGLNLETLVRRLLFLCLISLITFPLSFTHKLFVFLILWGNIYN